MKILVLHSDIAADAPPEEQDTLVAAEAVRAALVRRGHAVAKAAFVADKAALKSLAAGFDIIFNLVESVDGKGALATMAQRLFAELKLRFTGTSAEAMDLTNDKPMTKRWLSASGLATPFWSEPPKWVGLGEGPYIVKSALEDASLGLDDGCIVSGAEGVKARAAECAARFGGRWFAEAFIDGREFNIAVLGRAGKPRILPMAEMKFADWPEGKPRIVGYQAKWDEESAASRHTVRRFGVERDEPALAAEIRHACELVWDMFGLCGFVRVDFRVDEAGTPYILEINANPCISPDAGFAAAAEEAGMSYDTLIEEIVQAGL